MDAPTDDEQPLTRRERLRRVVNVCSNFSRNLAYYCVGGGDRGRLMFFGQHPHCSFWRQTHSNFFDLCVLEWCKLFAERARKPDYGWGEHGWRTIVTDVAAFEAGLLSELDTTAEDFCVLIEGMRRYRDTFVAHLDTDRDMYKPMLSQHARRAVWFYHRHVAEQEAAGDDLLGFPDSAERMAFGYQQCVAEATEVYRVAATLLDRRLRVSPPGNYPP